MKKDFENDLDDNDGNHFSLQNSYEKLKVNYNTY